jgi:hypothetical protein
MKTFVAILMTLLFASSSYALEIVTDYDVAIELAKKTEKNVLLIFSLENCQYCDLLKEDMPNMRQIDDYIVCVLDSRKNKKLTGTMNIKKWPTSVVMVIGKENQGESDRLVGYSGKGNYDTWLKKNAKFFSDDNVCGCDCVDTCRCRKNGICTCCGKTCNCKK